MAESARSFWKNNWPHFFTIGVVIYGFVFNFGYDKKTIENKPDRTEVQKMITDEMQKGYVEINRVPGLKEKIEAMEKALGENKELTQKIYEIILRGN